MASIHPKEMSVYASESAVDRSQIVSRKREVEVDYAGATRWVTRSPMPSIVLVSTSPG